MNQKSDMSLTWTGARVSWRADFQLKALGKTVSSPFPALQNCPHSLPQDSLLHHQNHQCSCKSLWLYVQHRLSLLPPVLVRPDDTGSTPPSQSRVASSSPVSALAALIPHIAFTYCHVCHTRGAGGHLGHCQACSGGRKKNWMKHRREEVKATALFGMWGALI